MQWAWSTKTKVGLSLQACLKQLTMITCLLLLPAAAKFNAAAPSQREQKASVKQAPAEQHLYVDGMAAVHCIASELFTRCLLLMGLRLL